MPWDTDHIRQLLDEVVITNGDASARKSEELLRYIEGYRSHEEPADEQHTTASDGAETSDEPRTDGQ